MSAAAAADPVPAKGGKKRLLIIVAAALVLVAAGVAAVLLLKQNTAQNEDDDWDDPATATATAVRKVDPAVVPTFLPLDTFTVNLADRTAERYAQVGITLEVDTQETSDRLKAYMPAIRNNILMVLSHKTSTELLDRAGKERLAMEIMREAVRPIGIDLEQVPPQADADGGAGRPQPKVHNPVLAVHFSNFIIQ